MMHDEGYIKFDNRWAKIPISIPESLFLDINPFRDRLYNLGLIGAYPDGIGFGNMSIRAPYCRREFWITGSSTGHLAHLSKAHYTRVTDFNILQNRVWSWGKVKASSESMSHAVLYCCDSQIQSVIHVHSDVLWHQLQGQMPMTDASILYGTPEMAKAIEVLYKTSSLSQQKILVMGGHKGGIITFGKNVAQAATLVIDWFEKLK